MQAAVSAHVTDKGIPTTGLLAQMLAAKFLDHMPLYRQEAAFERAGHVIARLTLAQWVGECGAQLQCLSSSAIENTCTCPSSLEIRSLGDTLVTKHSAAATAHSGMANCPTDTPPSVHPFDSAIALAPAAQAGHFSGATSLAYANVVGPFGGTTAATVLNAVLQHPARQGDPIALTVNYASAVEDGGFELVAHAARTNRSTQHWSVVLRQGGATAATATAVLARRRETWSAPDVMPPANLPPPDTLMRVAGAKRPPWFKRYDMRFVCGALPEVMDGEEHASSYSSSWVRDEPARPLDFASLAAICDCFFPRVFMRRRLFVPIGTVTLTTYFHADAAMLTAQGERPVLGVARALNFRNGYFDQTAEVWSDGGNLLASTHQMVYYRK